MRIRSLIVAIAAVLAGLVLAGPAQAYPSMPQRVQGPYTVLKVVDGDTIHVSANGQKLKIRMIGLDTPETVDPRKPVQCFGLEASAQAKTILGGQAVYLETDPSPRLGRPLRSHAGLCLDRIGAAVQPGHDRRRVRIRVHLRSALSLPGGFQGRRERRPDPESRAVVVGRLSAMRRGVKVALRERETQ